MVYQRNSVGIGEHPDVLAAIQDQIDVIAKEEERLEVIDRHFTNHAYRQRITARRIEPTR